MLRVTAAPRRPDRSDIGPMSERGDFGDRHTVVGQRHPNPNLFHVHTPAELFSVDGITGRDGALFTDDPEIFLPSFRASEFGKIAGPFAGLVRTFPFSLAGSPKTDHEVRQLPIRRVIHGVGDDHVSWGFDGERARLWHGGSKRWSCRKWQKGDTICLCVDLGDEDGAIDALHRAATDADAETYFGLYADDAVFIGTDPAERWDLPAFRDFAAPHFEEAPAWAYTPVEREVHFGPKGRSAWFYETLSHERYGAVRGSGALRLQGARGGAPRRSARKVTQN